jgi:O-antigen ligase
MTLRSFAFKCALVLVFLRFSFLPETVAYFTGINTYVLYIFGPPALLGVIASGGLKRTFRYAPARFWLAFIVYMVLAVPFSSWRGDSIMVVQSYIRTNFIMLLVTAGLAMTWVECRSMMYAVAAAAIINSATTHLLINHTASSERLVLLSRGMIADPNDLAAHLLLVLPFLLFIVLRRRTPVMFRLIVVAAMADGMFLILRSGSRGGLIALIFTLTFILIFGSARQRVAVGITAPVMLIILITLLPGPTWKRLNSFSKGPEANEGAVESSESRRYLLKKSIEFTFKKPFFGVGPGQFSYYEGGKAVDEGRRGNWHDTHNTYTQISSECGIPALVFYLGALISTFVILRKIQKKATKMYKEEIVTATFCITLGLIAYSAASMFLTLAYMFQWPAISGLVIAIWRSVSKDRPSPGSDNILTEHADPEGAEMSEKSLGTEAVSEVALWGEGQSDPFGD